MLVPVSLLGAYDYCPRKLFLERVLKIVIPPKEVLVKGSIKHFAFELFNSVEEPLVKSVSSHDSAESIFSRYKAEYTKILRSAILRRKDEALSVNLVPEKLFSELLPLIVVEAKYRSALVFGFAKTHNVFSDELWDKLIPKIKSEYSLQSEKLMLTGRIDQLHIFPGFFIPVELKSGKLPHDVWPGHKLQLAGYALLIEDKFGVSVNKAVVRYIDHDVSKEVLLNPFLKQETISKVKEVYELLSSIDLPARVSNENKCISCDAKPSCFDDAKLKGLLSKGSRNHKLVKTAF